MDRKILEQEITDLLETIKEESDIIMSHPGMIPQIELDLLMSNLRRLYQAVYDINKANTIDINFKAPKVEAGGKPVILDFSPHMYESRDLPPRSAPVAKPEPPVAKPDLPVEDAKPEPLVEVSQPVEAPEIKAENPPRPAAPQSNQPDLFSRGGSITLADKLKSENGSIYDKLGKESRTDILADRIQQNRIEDLRLAMGISEKFMMVNDLFGGDLKSYDETIDHLNGLGTFQEAAAYLEVMGEKFRMDVNSPAFLLILQILRKRYL